RPCLLERSFRRCGGRLRIARPRGSRSRTGAARAEIAEAQIDILPEGIEIALERFRPVVRLFQTSGEIAHLLFEFDDPSLKVRSTGAAVHDDGRTGRPPAIGLALQIGDLALDTVKPVRECARIRVLREGGPGDGERNADKSDGGSARE